eukprot:TRINITY_DN2189_c0_g1_i1.p1 TRINITY_DN2189_c0_g1~~TRINITY_DN2189_c0_g1_i1.p1  ORF type:complete len:341 (+),score=38.32 TRINITY_DN2189_c0_g1_i1:50-1024(+)
MSSEPPSFSPSASRSALTTTPTPSLTPSPSLSAPTTQPLVGSVVDLATFPRERLTVPNRATSWVWDYLRTFRNNKKLCVCLLCGLVKAYHSTTSTHEEHILKHAPYLKYQDKYLTSAWGGANLSVERQDEYLTALATYIAKTGQPYSLADDEYFREFITTLRKAHYSVNRDGKLKYQFGRKAVTTRISRLCANFSENIVPRMIVRGDDVSVQVSAHHDVWTSRHSDASYGNLSLSWIDSEWKYKDLHYDLYPLPLSHAGNYLGQELLKSFETLRSAIGGGGIDLNTITTDTAANNTKMHSFLKTTFPWVDSSRVCLSSHCSCCE